VKGDLRKLGTYEKRETKREIEQACVHVRTRSAACREGSSERGSERERARERQRVRACACASVCV